MSCCGFFVKLQGRIVGLRACDEFVGEICLMLHEGWCCFQVVGQDTLRRTAVGGISGVKPSLLCFRNDAIGIADFSGAELAGGNA